MSTFMAEPLMMDSVLVEINGEPIECLANDVEVAADVPKVPATTFCARKDYPGQTMWHLVAKFYQSFDAGGTDEILTAAREAGKTGPVPYKIRPKSGPISATNPSFEGFLIPTAYSLLKGAAGALSEVDIDWSMTAEPTRVITPGP